MQALGYFVDLYDDGLAAVNKYIANAPGATREAVGREIHSMGGAAAALGAVGLEEAAHRIDKLMRGDPARPADDGELRPALERLRGDLAELVAGLREALGRGARKTT
jgi:HPt (histidine-containing phosphotransfer) domain-containing protein